jgi:hypothetical protein
MPEALIATVAAIFGAAGLSGGGGVVGSGAGAGKGKRPGGSRGLRGASTNTATVGNVVAECFSDDDSMG